MTCLRRGTLILLGLGVLAQNVLAQEFSGEESEATPPPSSGPTFDPGPSSRSGSVFSPGSIFNPAPTPPPGSGASSGVGRGINAGSTSGGAAATDSTSSGVAPVMVNTGYGSSPQSFEAGKGRFARSPLRFTLSLTQGYDDNVFTVSDNQPKPAPVPAPTTEPPPVDIDPATGLPLPVPTPSNDQNPPAPEPLERQASAYSSADVGVQWQFLTPRTVTTLDAIIGGSYYWDRPGDEMDYHGLANVLYVHRLTPRMQLTTQMHAVYQSQPDFGVVNGPVRQSLGNYWVTNGRVDLSYQFSGRIQSVTSYSANAIYYDRKDLQSGNFFENVFGQQARYLLSARGTVVGEYRFSFTTYDDDLRNYNTHYLLAGLDFSLTQRFIATLRVGESIQSYEASGSQSTPYGESTLTYGYSPRSTLIWTNRYGFEEAGSATARRTSYRTSLAVNHAFTPKLSANLALYYNHYVTENEGIDDKISEDAIDTSLSLRYILLPNVTLTAVYSRTQLLSTEPASEYDRNRYWLGMEYTF